MLTPCQSTSRARNACRIPKECATTTPTDFTFTPQELYRTIGPYSDVVNIVSVHLISPDQYSYADLH